MTKIPVVYYSTYGHIERMAEAVAGGDGKRQPSATGLAVSRYQGQHVATLARKLAA